MRSRPRGPTALAPAVALAVAVVILAGGAAGGRAVAAPAAAAERVRAARMHYEKGVSHYNLDEFAPALEEFTEAYRLKPDPSFLFNIAQCHRKLGHVDAAIDYLRKYLRNVPETQNRGEIERMISELQARAGTAEPRDAPATPVAPPVAEAPPAPPAAAPAPALMPSAVPAPAAPAASLSTSPPPPPAKPFYRRWWFWTAVGAAAVAGLIVAVAASGPEEPYVGTLGNNRVP